MLCLKWRRCYFLYTYLSKSLRQSRSNLIFYMKISSKSWGGISTAVYFCFCFSPNNLLHLLVGCFLCFFSFNFMWFFKVWTFCSINCTHIHVVDKIRRGGEVSCFPILQIFGKFYVYFLKLRNHIFFFSKINNVIFITLIFKNSSIF